MDRHPGDRKTIPTPRKLSAFRVASPFVGRDDELRHLNEALDLAAEGQGGMIFLTGQPGIGKTRLAREAIALAKGRGFIALEGRAYPLGVGLAYGPLLDAFGPLLRSFDSNHLQTLVKDLPSLGRLFEGLGLPSPEPLGDPALEKTRLFEAMLRLIGRLTEHRPVVLFIDDLHWADPASLELLHYLARGLSHQRVLLLATHRPDVMDTHRGLRALVGPLLRDGLAEEIGIPRLDPEAVCNLIQGILGGSPFGAVPSDLLALLETRACGTPLFVEAFIAALIDSGDLMRSSDGWQVNANGATVLPASVRRLILDSLERLAPTARHVLDLISTMGDGAPHAILRCSSGLEEEALLDALQHLRAAGLVVEGLDGSDVTYRMTHPLIQQAVYAELPEMVRRRAHVAMIGALELFSEGQRADPSTLSGQALNHLAHHYRAAGPEADPKRALAVFLAAGERAQSLYANEEAAEHFGAALTILREAGGLRVEGGEGFPSPLPTLLERLGEVWARIGQGTAAIGVWSEALVLLSEGERAGDNVAAARLRRQLALAERDRGNFDIAVSHLKAGLEILAGREPCRELVDLQYTRSQILSRLGDVAGVAATTQELLSLAERLASPEAEGQANLAASFFHLWQNDIDRAHEHAVRALANGEAGQEPVICCRAYILLAAIGLRLDDHRLVRNYAERGLDVAQRLGAPELALSLRGYVAFADFLSGAWEESLRCSEQSIVLARRLSQHRDLAFSLAERAMILALRADLSEAESCISEARQALGSPSKGGPVDRAVLGFIDVVQAALDLERGQVERALMITQHFADPKALLTTPPAGVTLASVPIALMLLAEAQVAAGDPESALQTACKIVGLGPTDALYPSALAARAEGLARQALGQQEAAVACLARAYEGFTALEMPFEAARSLLEQAETHGQGLGDRGRGTYPSPLIPDSYPLTPAMAAKRSLMELERLGARRYVHRARVILKQLGISPRRPRQTRPREVLLSGRELQIASLVAEGLTNPEIAERLTLSRRTVTSHLEHIFARLGIGSRVALARYVTETRLSSVTDNN